jgi:hypothetical protein
MKIGILFFGQPRFFDLTKEFIKNEFTFQDHTTDYFAHVWDQIGYTPKGVEHDTSSDVNDILSNFFQAKDYKIDDYTTINKITNSFKTIFSILKTETNHNLPVSDEDTELRYKFSQHYSLEQAFIMLKKYEIKNNIKYDLVIKVRTDIVYNIPSLFPTFDEYTKYKNEAYFDISFTEPAVKCNGLRIIKLDDTDPENLKWTAQSIHSCNNKHIQLLQKQDIALPFEFTWKYRLAFNDWCLVANRLAADIMFSGWFTSFIHALGWDIDTTNIAQCREYIQHKPKFISNSEHALQGFMVYKNNINISRIQPQRRDCRLLKADELKKGVTMDGKIYPQNEREIIAGITKIFRHRYPGFYKKTCLHKIKQKP